MCVACSHHSLSATLVVVAKIVCASDKMLGLGGTIAPDAVASLVRDAASSRLHGVVFGADFNHGGPGSTNGVYPVVGVPLKISAFTFPHWSCLLSGGMARPGFPIGVCLFAHFGIGAAWRLY